MVVEFNTLCCDIWYFQNLRRCLGISNKMSFHLNSGETGTGNPKDLPIDPGTTREVVWLKLPN